MTEENRPDTPADTPADAPAEGQPEAASATATEGGEEQKVKLRQEVEIKDTGPCKKHIKVTVNREDIESRFGDHYSKLVKDSLIPGFRPGKAPRRIVEQQFKKDVGSQVKNEVLMASLEQLGDDFDLAPLSPPNLELDKIVIPKDGPLVYEFEVEVRPEFALPDYRGLKLKRYVKDFGEAEVAETRRRLLADYSQVVPKDGPAEVGDIVVAEVSVQDGGRTIGNIPESRFSVEKRLSFRDGLARKFSDQIKGAKAGDQRDVDVELSSQAAGGLGGKTVKATFHVKEIKTLRMPELTPEFLESEFGLTTPEQLDEVILVSLKRKLEHDNRRSARLQIISQIADASKWELPQDLLMRQARRALSRRIMEMKSDGMSDAEINKQSRLLQQNILETTALSLREHFVLQKIAETEKIDIDDDDLNDEIERMADQSGESPRRVRARLEKEDMLEALAAEMIERRALDLILDAAEYEDLSLDQEEDTPVATTEAQAVPGEMKDLPESSQGTVIPDEELPK
jgi:trigger factor